jgi:hypothetical protein
MAEELEFNDHYTDFYYLARVEMYLAAKYVEPGNYHRFIASNKVRKAIFEGTGYIEENKGVLPKNAMLDQIVSDLKVNVPWKPRSTAGHKAEYPRPGVSGRYQQQIDNMGG